MAEAATVAGDAKCVLVFFPCRFSKFLLVVDITRSFSPKLSPPAKKHIEQPDSLHSKPADMKILSKPSDSASFLTVDDPGTQIALIPGAIFLPSRIDAATLKSDSLLFVQDPINAASILVPFIASFS